MKHEIIEMTSDDRHVTTRGIFSGTNTGSMMGNPPTGNKVKVPFIVLDEFDSKGKLKFRNVQFDAKSFESQLMAGINPNAAYETNIRAMYAAADNADIDKFFSFWSDHSHPYFLGVENTRDEVKERIFAFKKGFPDVKRTVEEILFSGNKVIIRGVLTGSNKGSFMGKPATNNSIRVSWLGLYHFKQDGKIENGWVEYDSATLLNQLAKKPMPKKASK
jgi:predicted ester cyclase